MAEEVAGHALAIEIVICPFAPWREKLPVEVRMASPEAARDAFQWAREASTPSTVWIVTDGSVAAEGAGAAALLYRGNGAVFAGGGLRSAGLHSSTRLEVEAIGIGLELADRLWDDGQDVEDLRLATDSQAALQAITMGQTTTAAVCRAWRLVHRALGAGCQVSFTWVPGHAGIPENEEADRAAKAAGDGSGGAEERRLPHCAQSVRTRMEAYFDSKMQERWRGFMTTRPERAFPWTFSRSMTWTQFLSRAQVSLISQFLVNVFPNREFLFKCALVDSPDCRFYGNEMEDRVHILEDCPHYAPIRATCRIAISHQSGPQVWELPALVPRHLRILARFLTQVKADWDAQIGGTPWGPRLG